MRRNKLRHLFQSLKVQKHPYVYLFWKKLENGLNLRLLMNVSWFTNLQVVPWLEVKTVFNQSLQEGMTCDGVISQFVLQIS